MRTSSLCAVIAAVVTIAFALTGCATLGARPVTEGREALGTFVEVTAWGADPAAVRSAIGEGFAAMAAVEALTDAHDPDSGLGAWNADPFDGEPPPLPYKQVEEALAQLELEPDTFNTRLLGVTRLYAFEQGGRVPGERELEIALAESASMMGRADAAGFRPAPNRSREASLPLPGIDLGGAAKGMALDGAVELMGASGALDAALLTAGSSTLAWGRRPGSRPWRIGVEDPRQPGKVVAVFQSREGFSVSTTGDYQRGFDRNETRYHHVLDPLSGRPVRGLRSLTVAGRMPAMHSDILSTALFVMGPERAAAYATAHGLALYMVDEAGRALTVPAPTDSGIDLEELEEPMP